MTYCCGILVREGLVMIGDTRTNAGLDNVSTFRKLHIFEEPGKSIMALASAGNLSLSQTVLSILNEGIEILTDPDDFQSIRATLGAAGFVALTAQITQRAATTVELSGAAAQAMRAHDEFHSIL